MTTAAHWNAKSAALTAAPALGLHLHLHLHLHPSHPACSSVVIVASLSVKVPVLSCEQRLDSSHRFLHTVSTPPRTPQHLETHLCSCFTLTLAIGFHVTQSIASLPSIIHRPDSGCRLIPPSLQSHNAAPLLPGSPCPANPTAPRFSPQTLDATASHKLAPVFTTKHLRRGLNDPVPPPSAALFSYPLPGPFNSCGEPCISDLSMRRFVSSLQIPVSSKPLPSLTHTRKP